MYQLTDWDLDEKVDDDDNPAIRAAANPNSAVLEALLAYYKSRCDDKSLNDYEQRLITRCSPSPTIAFRSPIKAAISINSAENLRLLLAAGADPDGILRWEAADYSVRFIRGRYYSDNFKYYAHCDARSVVLAKAREHGIVHPVCPLTEGELDERRRWFPMFWTEWFVPGRSLRKGRAWTALEEAAGYGRPELFDLLRAAGADESAWVQQSESDDPESWNFDESAPVSFLTTSSPLHEALYWGEQAMVRHLLSTCGHSPNYRPRAAPTMALPPLSHILVRCDLDDENVHNCLVDLLAHPRLDLNLRTPVFGIHPLHFATAHHNPKLLTWLAGFIPGGLAAARTTALGHTLLHIACLPLIPNQIVAKNPNVLKSIHCIRTVDYRWHPRAKLLPSPTCGEVATAEEIASIDPQPLTVAEQQAQLATIRVLIEARQGQEEVADVRAKDVDGNTALHYLAGTLNTSDETIELVRGLEGGEEAWWEAKNHWGLTPSQLWGE
ncbi:hypothetical protein ASPCAL13571 [Aspergillus calidoustus]|uniref:Uncharacterized protein n=1 Tax=Aspergillus calidoustus TaxID=454130 RepID=A0A0U5H8J6_ASPCI|nr:hypothetical protein ASPCAL13571 [Aspergillus calidoustus]